MRDRLEGVDAQEGLADYVECVIKETLRRLHRLFRDRFDIYILDRCILSV